jgi:hypothetical protein
MKSLGSILKSGARADILRVLFYAHHAVSLRQLARLAEVHPHSAEIVMNDLLREKLVRRRKTSARCFYWKDPGNPDWLVIDGICRGAEQARLAAKRPDLNKRAQFILPFIEEAGAMLFKARRSRRVS